MKKAKKTKKSAAKKTVSGLKKTKKRSALFSGKELDVIKNKLSGMKESLSRTVENKKNMDMIEPEVGDPIDQATQSLDKEILFELSDNERLMLDDIEAALRKIDNGFYGVCEHCRKDIGKKRLQVLPSARYCLPCQSGTEKRKTE